jgi:hypothetical protein
MGIDRKYGRVTVERGSIGEDEPVVVFRAQDQLLPEVLGLYAQMCLAHGSPADHIVGLELTARQVIEWQREHRTQVPQSAPDGQVQG